MKKTYVDVYYDDELDPPCWGARKYEKDKDGSLIVIDFTCAENKKDAQKIAKEWRKKIKKVV